MNSSIGILFISSIFASKTMILSKISLVIQHIHHFAKIDQIEFVTKLLIYLYYNWLLIPSWIQLHVKTWNIRISHNNILKETIFCFSSLLQCVYCSLLYYSTFHFFSLSACTHRLSSFRLFTKFYIHLYPSINKLLNTISYQQF